MNINKDDNKYTKYVLQLFLLTETSEIRKKEKNMNGKKGVNVELIDSNVQSLEVEAGDMDDLTLNVSNLQGPLMDCWEGVEAEACVDFINNLSTKMSQMSEQIRKIEDWMKSVSQAYQDDATNGQKAYQF